MMILISFQDATNYWEPHQQDRHNPPSIFVTIPTPTQECTNCVIVSFVGVWHNATLVLSECKCLTWSCCFSWFWWTGDVEIAMHKGRLGEISTPQSKIPLSQSLEWPDITHIKNYMSLCLRHQPLHLFSNYHLCLNNTLDDYMSNSEFVISIIDLPFFLQLIKSAAPKQTLTQRNNLWWLVRVVLFWSQWIMTARHDCST